VTFAVRRSASRRRRWSRGRRGFGSLSLTVFFAPAPTLNLRPASLTTRRRAAFTFVGVLPASLPETAKSLRLATRALTGPRAGIRLAARPRVTSVRAPNVGSPTTRASLVWDELPAAFDAVTRQR
jgi:hypothetical protein